MDTIQGVLKYQRPGADGKVRWAPPTALRRIDLILLDEGSQYEDSAPLSLQFILWVSLLIDTNGIPGHVQEFLEFSWHVMRSEKYTRVQNDIGPLTIRICGL